MNIPMTVGAIAFGITVIAALAALSARETYRMRLEDLGHRDAQPIEKHMYDQMREQAIQGITPSTASAARTLG